ncbi:hypothetical protein FSP39_005576 [Pinctada imbricata]|uniref:Caveolin n=1 Tax=Pinctada imbricata TaxID=66713 RepID=A0AA88Y2J1_PINIB|nr:hypothetical protein FSP39_005576 [Pinctada imbricata]
MGHHSFDFVWDFSKCMFSCCVECWYGIATILFGFWIALFWGIQFGILAFQNVWICSPIFKCTKLNTECIRHCCNLYLGCCLTPLTESCGGIFVKFHRDRPRVAEEKPPVKPKKVTLQPPIQAIREPSFMARNAHKSISRQLGLFLPTKPNKVQDRGISDLEW